MDIALGLLLILLLTAATGYFVSQEFAYVAVERTSLKALADDGDPAAARALKVTERLSFMLSGAQLGITVTALLVGYVGEPFVGQGLAAILSDAGVGAALSLTVSVFAALAISTVVQMVLGELAPKNFAIARTVALARALSGSTLLYLRVAGPVIRIFDTAANRLLRRLGIEPVEELPVGATPEDLGTIIAEARADGMLDEATAQLLERGLEFRVRTAGEVMRPRVDVVTVKTTDPVVRVIELLDSGHTRFPVLGPGGVDDVRGVVSVLDILTVARARRSSTPIADVATAPLLLPEMTRVPAVLERLRAEHRQMAVVVDEFGGFAGIVTLEDLSEELVGPIMDEDDLAEPTAVRRADGIWLLPARWRIDEIADATGVLLPDDGSYETLSGLILSRLGRVPRSGDLVQVELEGQPAHVELEVLEVARHVATTVALHRVAHDLPDEATGQRPSVERPGDESSGGVA
jgi:CBS domain containing-hemolysin-like protein